MQKWRCKSFVYSFVWLALKGLYFTPFNFKKILLLLLVRVYNEKKEEKVAFRCFPGGAGNLKAIQLACCLRYLFAI